MSAESKEFQGAERPLSPHLQVYRPQITSVLSITHRITGAALASGTILLTAWLVMLAYFPEAFEVYQSYFTCWPAQVILGGFSLAVYYHLLNGIRHLIWDTGAGMDIPTVTRTGWIVVFGAVVLTAATWFVILI